MPREYTWIIIITTTAFTVNNIEIIWFMLHIVVQNHNVLDRNLMCAHISYQCVDTHTHTPYVDLWIMLINEWCRCFDKTIILASCVVWRQLIFKCGYNKFDFKEECAERISLYFPDIKQQCRSLSECSAHRNLLSFITTNCLPLNNVIVITSWFFGSVSRSEESVG